MLKTICLLVIGGILFSCFAEKKEDTYKLFYPKNIPVNSTFEAALITSKISPAADTLELYIQPGNEISLLEISLKSFNVDKTLNFISASRVGVSGNLYKTDIDLTDSSLSAGAFFQVVMTLKAEYGNNSNLKIYGEFKSGNKIVGTISNDNLNNNFEDKFVNTRLSFYRSLHNAGKCLRFDNNASLKISLNNVSTKNLLTEFWIKLNGFQHNFFNISNKSNSSISFSLSVNPFQMLIARASNNSLAAANPVFISSGSWYHIAVDFSITNNLISFYCGRTLLSQINLPPFINTEDLIYSFQNDDTSKQFQIDLLRFIDLENSVDVSFENQNYLNFISDSSSVLSQFDFDEQSEIYSSSNGVSLSYSNLVFTKSDAPIFARAPELNITPSGNSYNLEWNGGDYRQAEQYILQKSTGNSGFEDLYSVQADNTTGKNYSYMDQPNESDDVVYYRIKQVNIDGSVVYSDAVKVGQGFIKPFVVQQNYPNPFNPNTSILVTLIEDTQLEVAVYDIEGKEIQELFKGYLSKGSYTFNFNAVNLPSGIYFCKVATPNFSEMKKMIYTK